jgi:selenocysteine lyase/cysteine desulfurase
VDPRTAELPADGVRTLLGARTRLVAVTAASNLVGTRPDVPAITAAARAVGAVSFVDGVHHTPHAHVDLAALGADLYATSAYKWAGPHLAAVVAADPGLLEGLHPDRLLPSPDTVPERFELGTNPFASLAGVVAAVHHLAGLDDAALGTRRERLATSRRAAGVHEDQLGSRMLAGLAATPGVTLYGSPAKRTPTAYFRLVGRTPAEVAEALSARGINCWHGHAYAWELAGALGLRETGGAVRTSVNHYSTATEVDQLLDAVATLAAGC